MAFLSPKSVVSYRCSCGQLKPNAFLHFCRYCFELRCDFCVSHELDARHCVKCPEVLHATEAWTKNNCCSNCLLCPLCRSNLTMRATQVQPPRSKEETGQSKEKAPPVKVYYLMCPFCQWTTRDVGLPDVSSSSTPWPTLENPFSARIEELVEYYKSVAICDRLAKDKKSHGTRRAYSHISGMSVAMVRQKAGLPSNTGTPFRSAAAFQDSMKPINVNMAMASDIVDNLPNDIYTTVPDLSKVTTLKQRLALPELEPKSIVDVRPSRCPLLAKRTLRCRVCEHNVIKPEYSPQNIKFKIQHSAFHNIPGLRIKTVEPLRAGQAAELLLLVLNPTQHPTTVDFLPLNHEEPKPEGQESIESKTAAPVPVQPLSLTFTGTIDVPVLNINIPGRDDIDEFDDDAESSTAADDSKFIAWRKGNKVVVKLRVHPNEDIEVGTEVKVGFTLRHIFTNTVIHQDKKELKKINHAFNVILSLGKSLGSVP